MLLVFNRLLFWGGWFGFDFEAGVSLYNQDAHEISVYWLIKKKIMTINWAWPLIPIILPFGRLGQENCYEMKDSLGYRRSPAQNSSKSDNQMLSPWIYWTFNTRFWLLRPIRRCEWGHRGHRGTLDWSLGNCFPEEGPFELELRETEEERKSSECAV